MGLRKTSILLLILMGFAHGLKSQEIDAGISQDQDSILIGDHVLLNIWLQAPADAQIIWPEIHDTLTKDVEVIEKTAVDTIRKNTHLRLEQQLRVTSFEPGLYQMDPVRFRYQLPDDTVIYIVNTQPWNLLVSGMAVDTAQAIRSIKGPIGAPYTFRELLPWILASMGMVALAVLGMYYYRRKKNAKPLFSAKPKPKLPPHIMALNRLEQLKQKKLWQQGEIKAYYTELTDVVRIYIEERFHIPAMEMTSYEIMNELPEKEIGENEMARLEQTFALANLAKFAREQPLPADNEDSFTHAKKFIESTIIRPEPFEPDSGKAGKSTEGQKTEKTQES